MAKLSDLEPLIINEWLKRPNGKRTEADILKFYGYLSKNRPSLLNFRTGIKDKYQALKSILEKYITRE